MLSATWFCLGNGFLGSRNLWVLSAEVFAALYGAFGKNCIGTRYVFMLLLDVPFPRLKQHYNWYGDCIPKWILDAFPSFKPQEFQCGESWVKEALLLLNWHAGYRH